MPRNASLFNRLRFECKKYLEFSSDVRRKIRDASLRQRGVFCSKMAVFADRATIKVAFLNNGVVGWAAHFLEHGHHNIYMYVKRSYRRHGVGTKLLADMLNKFPSSVVHPHDKASKAFFNSGRVSPQKINWETYYDYYDHNDNEINWNE